MASKELRTMVRDEKKRLYAIYGKQRHESEGWALILMEKVGFAAGGVTMDIEGEALAKRIATVIAWAELWAERELV